MLQQILAVTAANLKSVPQRLGTSMVIVIGIAGVVGVLVALLSMAAGFAATLAATGRPDRAIVLRGGASDELSSVIDRSMGPTIRDTAGIRRGADGLPLALLELYLLVDVTKKGETTPANVIVRGTEPRVFAVRNEGRIVAGRMFGQGKRELIVGRAAQSEFAGLEIGDKVEVRDGPWTVVGVFSTAGDAHESELWADVATLQTASRRIGYSSVTVQLEDAAESTFQAFKDRLTTNPQLKATVQRETEFYASRSRALSSFVRYLGYTVASIMAVGALFGALNCMYAAVSTRTVEIATLRAIGFSGTAVVASVLIEAMLLALAGGVIGAGISYVVFNGYTVTTLNFQTFSQTAFAFRVTPELLWVGLQWALLIGLIGGFFPALRAARLPVVEALRAQ